MTEREGGTEISNYDAASGTILGITKVFLEASRIFIFMFSSNRHQNI
jgi:hypothetical protein